MGEAPSMECVQIQDNWIIRLCDSEIFNVNSGVDMRAYYEMQHFPP